METINSIQTEPTAVITGADGGMGTEITRAVAQAGYHVVMASCRRPKAEAVRRMLLQERADLDIEVRDLDLASMCSVVDFAEGLAEDGIRVRLLMNCAGTMETGLHITEDGLERTVSVNYVGHYLLTRKLVGIMERGGRIVNMVSCTYAIGRLDFPDFFRRGRKGSFWRIPVYSNTKLALTLFTLYLSQMTRPLDIKVNAADPGIVSTDIITMHMWFDPLTDVLFRPFIRTPRQGADTAIRLQLDDEGGQRTGTYNVSGHVKRLSDKYLNHPQMRELWLRTEYVLEKWL